MKTSAAIGLLAIGMAATVSLALVAARRAQALPDGVKISQVYGGGGNTGAAYRRDFVELFNAGPAAVDITGWTMQYASATGATWSATPLTGTLMPGQYYLIQLAGAGGGSQDLPPPDASGSTAMAASTGKIALVSAVAPLTGACPAGAAVMDLVGYGTGVTCVEGTQGPAPGNTVAIARNLNGCMDTDNNASDFAVAPPTPRNSGAPRNVCGLAIGKSAPGFARAGQPLTYTLVVTNTGIGVPGLVMTDRLPAGTAYVAGSASDGGGFQEGVILWQTGALSQGSVARRSFVVVPSQDAASVVNEEYGVSAPGTVVLARGQPVTTTVAPLQMRQTGPLAASSGAVAAFTILYNNAGDQPIANVSLTDRLPDNMRFVAESTGTALVDGGTVAWTLGTLGPGAGGSIVISATADSPGLYVNRALINGLYGGLEQVEASADWAVTVGGGDPFIMLSGPAALIPGEMAEYTVVYGESGGWNVDTPVTLNLILPQGFTAGDILGDTSGLSATDTASGRTWSAGALAAGSRLTFTLTVRVPYAIADSALATNTVTLLTAAPGNLPSNDAASHTGRASMHVHTIQGRGHRSPLEGAAVENAAGIVTARQAVGFVMQDWLPDGDAGTSEAIFVSASSMSPVEVGDLVLVDGAVAELRPDGENAGDNLTVTTLVAPSNVRVWSSGRPLPAPELVGMSGRYPPDSTLTDARGDLEAGAAFDPGLYTVDFYESLEWMRVQVNDTVVVGPSEGGELVVLPDGGAGAAARTPRGGVLATLSTLNPGRIVVRADWSAGLPGVNVGDRFSSPLAGILDYGSGAYRLQLAAPAAPLDGGLVREAAQPALPQHLSIATLNMGSLNPQDAASRFNALASLIVDRLRAPDLIAVQGIQDNSGAADDGVVDASQTVGLLIDAIRAVDAGLVYEYRGVNPMNNADGGASGVNARVGFLFRTGGGLAFVDRSPGDATMSTAVVGTATGPELTHSPGLIEPSNAAFNGYPKSLAGEFIYNGRTVFAIAAEFASPAGDGPLFGRYQPPVARSPAARAAQAAVVNSFVDQIMAIDPEASVVILGSFGDTEYSPALRALAGEVAVNLAEARLPAAERYTSIDQGNARELDHILASRGLYTDCAELDIVHANAEFVDRPTAGDSVMARCRIWPAAPEPASVVLTATPAVIAAGGNSSGRIVATVRDNAGDPIPSVEVVFTATAGSITPSGATDSNGVVAATLTSAQQPATALVTARAGLATGSVSVVFEERRVASLAVTATPNSLPADGVSTSAIVVQAMDQFGSPVGGAPVSLAASLGSVGPQAGLTDASGLFTSTLTASRDPGNAIVTAASGLVRAEVSVAVEPASSGLRADYRASAPRVTRGDLLAYTFVVTNAGPAEVSGVGMAAEVPTGTVLLYVSGGWPEFRQIGWPITWRGLAGAMRTMAWTGKLAAGQSHTLRFVVWVNASSGVLSSRAAYGLRPGLETTFLKTVDVVPSPRAFARIHRR